ncbi:MAG: DUF4440 domain-containing protein [Solirubrobacteraceae bacterium]
MPFGASTAAGGAPPADPLAGTPFRRAWDRLTARVDPMVLTGGAVVVAVGAVIAVVVLASGGGGGTPSPVIPAASSVLTETTSTEATESTASEGSASEAGSATVESSTVEQELSEYAEDYSNEDVEGLKDLFAEDLERHEESHAPEDLAAALANYEKQFGELEHPVYTLTDEQIEPGAGEASVTAHWSVTSQNPTRQGTIHFHLVQQEERLLIDRLAIEDVK